MTGIASIIKPVYRTTAVSLDAVLSQCLPPLCLHIPVACQISGSIPCWQASGLCGTGPPGRAPSPNSRDEPPRTPWGRMKGRKTSHTIPLPSLPHTTHTASPLHYLHTATFLGLPACLWWNFSAWIKHMALWARRFRGISSDAGLDEMLRVTTRTAVSTSNPRQHLDHAAVEPHIGTSGGSDSGSRK